MIPSKHRHGHCDGRGSELQEILPDDRAWGLRFFWGWSGALISGYCLARSFYPGIQQLLRLRGGEPIELAGADAVPGEFLDEVKR